MNRSVFSRPHLLLTFGLLLAPAAGAQQSELVARHPCHIVDVKAKAQLEEFQVICATELARGDAQFVDSTLVHDFLDKQAKGSCVRAKNRNECLGKLAVATQASRAVLITINPGQLTRVSGVVVNPLGEVLDQKSIQLRARGESATDTLRKALKRLLDQLSISPVKIAPLITPPEPSPPLTATPPAEPAKPAPGVAQAPPPAPDAARPDIVVELESREPRTARTWKTPAAYAAAGTGVVAIGLGVLFGIQSNNTVDEFNRLYEGADRPAGSQYPVARESLINELTDLRQQVGNQRTLAGVSVGVGAALIGAGTYLWLSDRPASLAPGTTSLSVGPGGVNVRVLLP